MMGPWLELAAEKGGLSPGYRRMYRAMHKSHKDFHRSLLELEFPKWGGT